jgi:hypothetical protein
MVFGVVFDLCENSLYLGILSTSRRRIGVMKLEFARAELLWFTASPWRCFVLAELNDILLIKGVVFEKVHVFCERVTE